MGYEPTRAMSEGPSEVRVSEAAKPRETARGMLDCTPSARMLPVWRARGQAPRGSGRERKGTEDERATG
jgi:hypothetical protein